MKAKAKRTIWDRQPGETNLQHQSRIARLRQDERDRSQPLVSPEAAAHGNYVAMTVDNFDDNTRAVTMVNKASSPLAAWRANNKLTETQEAAIQYVLRLWQFMPPQPACTAAYGTRIVSSGYGFESEAAANAWFDAMASLKRLHGYIPTPYWQVFENCIRFDMPSGVAGSELGYGDRSGKGKALLIVQFVADIIAMHERLTGDTPLW